MRRCACWSGVSALERVSTLPCMLTATTRALKHVEFHGHDARVLACTCVRVCTGLVVDDARAAYEASVKNGAIPATAPFTLQVLKHPPA